MVKKLFSFASSLETSKQVTKGTEPRANFETKHNRKAVCTSTPVKNRGRSCTRVAGRLTTSLRGHGHPSEAAAALLTRQGNPLSGAHAATGGQSIGPALCSADSHPAQELWAQWPEGQGTGHRSREARPCHMHLLRTLSLELPRKSRSKKLFPMYLKVTHTYTHMYTHVRTEVTGPINITGIFFSNHCPLLGALCSPQTS